ncbi:membrane-bound lytic murein transglycosylase MltF [Balneatrix alpica]|uniref:Membrane-bound lytic murein transglycosylase F n=1 Tax=Balneatrix alpica TaxID=75684 RepID=A0ABV5ZBY9_9GAMM|nr:membrane-bound lytic murein transglycosylase MltF [Balneatrix alpica]
MWMRGSHPFLFWLYLSLIILIPLIGSQQQVSQLTRIDERGVLKVATRNIPTAYFEDADGPAGFEYELLKTFADQRNLRLELKVVQNRNDLFELLRQRDVDMAAASLFLRPERQQSFPTSEPYAFAVSQVVYLGDDKTTPQSVAELIGKRILVQSGSAHAQRLQELQQEWPELDWMETEDMDVADMLEMLREQEADVLITDHMTLAIYAPLFPDIQVAFSLDAPKPLVWYLAPTMDDSLRLAIDQFLVHPETQVLIEKLREKYFEHTRRYDFTGIKAFRAHIQSRLPDYRNLFERYANQYQLDWQLLAAIGYQESKWDPKAVSPTGVKGLMMLTLPTAKAMGVSDRQDVEQSIAGGSRYMRYLIDLLPARIQEPDRTWLALAAYNVGIGHLEDARILTQRAGYNPDRWSDVRQFLPKLAHKRWYSQTKHGYARGWEPVIYVRNIRLYREILRLEQLPANTVIPAAKPKLPKIEVFKRIPPTL